MIRRPILLMFVICMAGLLWPAPRCLAAETIVQRTEWVAAVTLLRNNEVPEPKKKTEWFRLKERFPIECYWVLQDGGPGAGEQLLQKNAAALEERLLANVLSELEAEGSSTSRTYQRSQTRRIQSAVLEQYLAACMERRELRLQATRSAFARVVFTKRRTVRPSFFAYTEGQSDAQAERHFLPGSELCLLEMEGMYGRVRTLVSDPGGVIRDPAVNWDATRVVFAWKKSLDHDDYHLYELEISTGAIRQLTFGLGFADYEPAYLPNGDIIFASTRCVQTVDCFWTEASNLYTCDGDGRGLRRLTFDQVHAIFPQVLDDGRVIYTRWDYNDRGQVFPQPLFQMNQDGTMQTEFYGNNSWFPTTIAHARGIPGTERVLAILCGHHSSQAGKLAVIDPARGRQENQGVQLVAPERPTPAERIDAYGQEGELWQYPFPLTENECLVTFAPGGWNSSVRRQGDADFGIYWMDFSGRRELLVLDPKLPCAQPVPLAARRKPPVRASAVDFAREDGIFYMQDIYSGAGLEGVPRGTIKKLRVVALDFRPAGIGQNFSAGPGGGALISTPIAIGNGAWDVKTVLGEVEVQADGSAVFSVPARTPVYFQALDDRGYAVQTMRSWTTLQPGEALACVGCHEHKNSAPPAAIFTERAASPGLRNDVQKIAHLNERRGFSFNREVQPVLDKHCIRCHHDRGPILAVAAGKSDKAVLGEKAAGSAALPAGADPVAFSLLGNEVIEDRVAKRKWSDSYLTLTSARPDRERGQAGAFQGNPRARVVNWVGSQSVPEMLPPFFAGAARSALLTLLTEGHAGVSLSRDELGKLACWIDLLVPYCGDYQEANAWTPGEHEKFEYYAAKRARMESLERENIRAIRDRISR